MGDNAFTLMPMSQTMSLAAGKTYDGYISVANPLESTSDFEYLATVTPYSVMDERYTADLTTQTNWSLIKDWITIENPTGTVKPNETVKIHFAVKVPDNAPAGGQYAAITVRSNSDVQNTEGVAVNNVIEMASLIFAEVQGETVHGGEVLSNTIPGFVTTLPLITSVSLTNESNVHETAVITIEVKDTFTGNMIFPMEDENNIFTEVTMPETSRVLTREISQLADLGVYEVSQTVKYLGKSYDTTQTVFVCPLWFLGLVALTVIVAVWTVVRLVRRHKGRKVAL